MLFLFKYYIEFYKNLDNIIAFDYYFDIEYYKLTFGFFYRNTLLKSENSFPFDYIDLYTKSSSFFLVSKFLIVLSTSILRSILLIQNIYYKKRL
jgi:hypothetical protein